MISKYLKKMICSLLAVLMVITAVPVNAIAFEMEQIGESVDAEENVVFSDTEEEIFFEEAENEAETLLSTKAEAIETGVYQRILQVVDEMKEDFPNDVFSVNGKNCYIRGGTHACNNCRLNFIVEDKVGDTNWVKQKIISSGDYESWSCNAFAKYAFVRIFGTMQEGTFKRYENIGKANQASTYSKCKIGDIIFASGGHAMVYLWHDDTGVTVLDANGYADLKIRFAVKYNYKDGGNLSGNVSIRRSNNWDKIDKEYGHSYDKYGYCSHCKKYYEEINKVTSIDGTLSSTEKVKVKPHPYTGDEGVYQDRPGKGPYKIIGKIENHYGNTWYKISYGSSKTGWVYQEENVTVNITNTINIELGMNKSSIPKGTSVWPNDTSKAYNYSAKVSSSNGVSKITSVTFEILKSNGTLTASNNRITKKPNAVSYAIKTSDDTTKFSELAVGSYILSLSATDENGKTANKKYNFTVYDNTSSNVPVTGISLNYSTKDLSVGELFQLTATITPSNATNKNVTWSSGNSDIATVSTSGLVEARTPGYVVITAKSVDGQKTTNCGIWVDAYKVEYDVNGGAGGPTLQMKKKGETLILSQSVPAKEGYTFVYWSGSDGFNYRPGGSYYQNKHLKLTAVWEEEIKTYSVNYDLNGGSANISATDVNEGSYLVLPTEVPTRPGYKFVGWKEPGTTGTNGWVTTKPSSGDYQTGYKYYTWGYEHNSDYTYLYGDDKNELIEHIKKNSGTFGSYNLKKMRYFSLIESSDKGSSYYPGKSGTNYNYFNVDYISEDGKTGTASIYKTVFYFESKVYKQEATGGKIYQPGDSYNVTKDVIFTAVWEEEQEISYGVTFDANGGIGGPLFARTIGTQFTVPEEIPTRENWVFLYWGGNKGIYRPGETYTISEDEELVAYWAPAWTPEITVGDVLVNPGDTIGVPIYIYNAKEPENTTIRFSVTSDDFTRTKYEYADEIPEYGCLGTAYFEIPEDTEPGEYPVSFNLTEYNISSGYIITDTVKIFDGSITVTDKKICTVTFDQNDGWEANTEKLEEGTSISFNDIYFEREGYTAECLKITEETKWGPKTYLADKNDMINVSSDMEIKTIWRNNSVEYPIISSKEVKAKPGDTVTVQVETSFKNGFDFGEWLLQWKNDQNIELKSSYNCSGENGNNIIYEFVFEIGDDVAPGKHSWNFSIVEAYTQEGELWAVKDIPITISVEKSNYGDLNDDNEVNIKDAYLARLIAAKLITATEVQSTLGDVDLDGKITAIDANLIRKYVVKLIDSLPIK